MEDWEGVYWRDSSRFDILGQNKQGKTIWLVSRTLVAIHVLYVYCEINVYDVAVWQEQNKIKNACGCSRN